MSLTSLQRKCCCGGGGQTCADVPVDSLPETVNISVSYSVKLTSRFWTVRTDETPQFRPEDYEDECPEIDGPLCCCPNYVIDYAVSPVGEFTATFAVSIYGTLLRYGLTPTQPLYSGQVSAQFEFASDFPYTPSRSGSYQATTNVPWSTGQPQAQGWHAQIECVPVNSVSRDLMKRQWGLSDTEPVIATGRHLVLKTGIGPSIGGLPSQNSGGVPPSLISDVSTSPPVVPQGQVQLYASPTAALLPTPTGGSAAIYSMPWRGTFALAAPQPTGTYKGTRSFSRYAATPSGVWVDSGVATGCLWNQYDSDGPWLGPVDELGESTRGPTLAGSLWNWLGNVEYGLPARGTPSPPNPNYPDCWVPYQAPTAPCGADLLGSISPNAGVIQPRRGNPCYPDGLPPLYPPWQPSVNAYRSDWAEMSEASATVS